MRPENPTQVPDAERLSGPTRPSTSSSMRPSSPRLSTRPTGPGERDRNTSATVRSPSLGQQQRQVCRAAPPHRHPGAGLAGERVECWTDQVLGAPRVHGHLTTVGARALAAVDLRGRAVEGARPAAGACARHEGQRQNRSDHPLDSDPASGTSGAGDPLARGPAADDLVDGSLVDHGGNITRLPSLANLGY